ncbi:MAG: hypothetical protein AB8I08_27715 [Sandaracinaceae bacterium]
MGIFTASVCDVGDTESMQATVTQTDGHLRIVTDELPSLLEGGADADGSFDVGGYATQFGGGLEITARSVGSIGPDGTLRAMIDSRSWGQVEDQGADCYGVREAIGTRDE